MISRNPTMWWMIGIEAVLLLLGEVIIIAFLPDKMQVGIGYAIGIITCVILLISMMNSLESAAQESRKQATAKMQISAAVRSLAVILIAGIMYWLKVGNILAFVVALWTLKLTAYIQPFTYKLLQQFRKDKEH